MRLMQDKFQRQTESLRLFEPMKQQTEFFQSNAFVRLARGGQRSGKTITCAVELARAALKCDPHQKWPENRPLTIWCLAKSEHHIGRVFWKNLFKGGAFRIIRDLETGKWRTFRHWQDKARESEARNSPPLIPKREYNPKEVAWRDKKEQSFSCVRLFNGTEIYAFSANGDPPTGNKVDIIWIDEDIENEEYIFEMILRLLDLNGKLMWSAFPNTKRNDILVTLSQRAIETSDNPNADIKEVHFPMGENKHIEAESKRRVRSILSMDEDQMKIRDEGEFLTDSHLMYPMYNKHIHNVPHEPGILRIDKYLADGQVPAHWARYLSIDPGHTIAACLFTAVPPEDVGDFIVFYDEVYMREANAEKFVKAIDDKASGQSFEAFIIDDHGSRGSSPESGRPLRSVYSEWFKRFRLESRSTGNGFISGTDNKESRAMEVRSALSIRGDGTTKVVTMRGMVPNFEMEIRRYKKHVHKTASGQTVILDVADPKSKWSHLMNSAEYVIAFRPKYIRTQAKKPVSPAYASWQNFLQKEEDRTGPGYIHLGPRSGSLSGASA